MITLGEEGHPINTWKHLAMLKYTIQGNLSIKDTLNEGHLSNEHCLQSQPHRAVYKCTSELGTPLYTVQPAGSQWCPL